MPEPRNGSSSAGRDKYAQIGNFVVGSEIGKGSFAQVYMGWHKVNLAARLPTRSLSLPLLRRFPLGYNCSLLDAASPAPYVEDC